MRRSKFALLILFFLLGCQTPPNVIPESNLSVRDHRRVTIAAFGEARMMSQNGREIYSHFHNRSFKILDEPNAVKTRYYTKVQILGARRPYEVAVEVHKEQKDPETKKFVDQGIDEGLSQQRLSTLRDLLNQSRDKGTPAFDVENPF